jgi:hypothetical protein
MRNLQLQILTYSYLSMSCLLLDVSSAINGEVPEDDVGHVSEQNLHFFL